MTVTFSQRAVEAAWNAYQNTPIDLLADSDEETKRCVVNALAAYHNALTVDGVALQAWRPIESAPRGKGLIDVWTVGWGAEPHRVSDCYYDSICDEWRTIRPTGQLICIKARYVTHWMPLPPPPAASEGEERK